MQRWPFPIHNGILESFACSSMNYLLMLLFLYWCISIVFLEAVEKLIEIYTFRIRKTTLSFTFLIRFRFQGYHWKSNIAIFVWRVTWNYTYSPFFQVILLIQLTQKANELILKILIVLGFLNCGLSNWKKYLLAFPDCIYWIKSKKSNITLTFKI